MFDGLLSGVPDISNPIVIFIVGTVLFIGGILGGDKRVDFKIWGKDSFIPPISRKTKKVFIILGCTFLALGTFFTWYTPMPKEALVMQADRTPRAEVTTPEARASVPSQFAVEGNLYGELGDLTIWLLVYPTNPTRASNPDYANKYYVQQGPAILETGEYPYVVPWQAWVDIYRHIEEEHEAIGTEFNILIMLADEEADEAFSQHLKEVEKGGSPGMSSPPGGAVCLGTIKVALQE